MNEKQWIVPIMPPTSKTADRSAATPGLKCAAYTHIVAHEY